MRKLNLTLSLSALLIISACNSAGISDILSPKEQISTSSGLDADYLIEETEAAYERYKTSVKEETSASETSADDIAEIKIPDKIIKTANISIEVDNYQEAIKKIKNTIEKWKGYISSENENSYSYMVSNIITIRVANENFSKLIEELTSDVKKVENKSINAVDVSEEFVDIQARLKTKKEVEKRYIELLKQAHTVTDILYVEEQIRVIREEIEAKEGRLKYLQNQVALSTITIEVKEYYEQDIYKPGFGEDAGKAFSGGWSGFLTLLIGLIYLWPLWLIIATVLFVLFKFVFKRKKQ